jgi:hypothetical protein
LKTAFQIGFLLYIPFLIIDTLSHRSWWHWNDLPAAHHGIPALKIVLFIVADGCAAHEPCCGVSIWRFQTDTGVILHSVNKPL